jgi:tetratricopeptide (TPR) repeat protein
MPHWPRLWRATLLGWLLASPVWASNPTPPEAREQYRLGLELYDERDYEGALEKFQASYGIFPSPNSELYVARCLRAMGRTEEAIRAYERAVELGRARAEADPKYADTYRVAQSELAVLKPPPAPRQRMVVATSVAAGVGVVGLASFVTFWLLARSRYHSLEANCRPLPCPASETGAVATGRQYQTAANISLAIGITGAATAVTLFVLGRPRAPAFGRLELAGTTLRFTGEL